MCAFRLVCWPSALCCWQGDEQLHLSPFLEQSLQDSLPQQQHQQQQQQQQQQSPIVQPSQQPGQLSEPWGFSRSCTSTNGLATSTSSPSSPSVAAMMANSPAALSASAGAGYFCALSSSSSGAHRFRSSLDLELMRHASQERAPSPALAGTPAASVPFGTAVAAVPDAGKAAFVGDPAMPSAAAAAAECCSIERSRHTHQQQRPAAACGGLAQQLAASPAGRSHDSHEAAASGSAADGPDTAQYTAAASTSSEINNGGPGGHSCNAIQQLASAVSAACCSSFDEYMAARKAELQQELGEGEGVSSLIAASHDFAQHCGNQVRLSCGGGQMEIGHLGHSSYQAMLLQFVWMVLIAFSRYVSKAGRMDGAGQSSMAERACWQWLVRNQNHQDAAFLLCITICGRHLVSESAS